MAALCMQQLVNLPVLCMQLNVWTTWRKPRRWNRKKWMRISPEMDQIWCEINFVIVAVIAVVRDWLQSIWCIDIGWWSVFLKSNSMSSMAASSRPASSSDSVLSLGCVLSFFSFVNSGAACSSFGPQLGTIEDARSKRNPCMLYFPLTNQHCSKRQGTQHFAIFTIAKLCFCFTGPLSKFRHVFERDAVVRPLCPLANPLCGYCCLGSCPFCVSGLAVLLWRNANLAGGFAGRLAGLCDFGLLWFACIFRTFWVFVQMTFLLLMLM